jgi:hypothetical protein
MITVRDRSAAISFSARTGEAGLVAGMLVKFVAGSASGEQPKVVKATGADMADATVKKGIVDYIQPDSLDVDFDINVVTQALTAQAKTIPLNAQVNVWMGTIVLGYHESLLPATLKPAVVREPAVVGFDGATNLPALAVDAEIDNGFVYRIDGPEVTMVFSLPIA